MKTLVLLLFTVLLSLEISANDIEKINKEMLLQTKHALDSTAHAAYLFHNAEVRYEIRRNEVYLVIKRHDRIKFYDDQAQDYADFAVTLYEDGRQRDKIYNIKAYTYNLEDGKVVKEKLDGDDIYEEEVNENVKVKKWAMPAIKAGSIIDVKYEIMTPRTYTIPRFHFQNYIPTNLAIYDISVPEYFTVTTISSGTVPVDVEKEVYRAYGYKQYATILTAKDVEAIEKDDYVLNIEDYRAGIKFELQSFSGSGYKTKYFTKDWKQIGLKYNEAEYFGKLIKKKYKELKPTYNKAMKIPESDRAKFIYDWVQENFIWNEHYGSAAYDGLKDVIKNKTGSIGEINLVLLNLFYHSKINAKPVLTKSRGKGILNINNPSITELNYLIAALPNQEGHIFLDATTKYADFGELPIRAVNLSGIILDKNGGTEIKIKNPNNHKTQTFLQLQIDPKNTKLYGSGMHKKSGYAATRFRMELDEIETEEDNQEITEDDDSDMEAEEESDYEDVIEITSVKNIEDLSKSIKVEYDAENYSCIKKIGDKFFIDAAIDLGIKKNPFVDDSRLFPIFFNYLQDLKRVISIEIPTGYVIESLPVKAGLSLPNNSGTFNYSAKQSGSKIMIYYTFLRRKDIFLPEEYPYLKEIYNIMIDKQNEKIILSKIPEEMGSNK